jgi:hypothetical protein
MWRELFCGNNLLSYKELFVKIWSFWPCFVQFVRFWKSNYCNMHIPLYLIIRSAALDHYSGIYWAKPFLCIHLQNNPLFCLIISLCTARNSVNGAFMPALALVIDSGSESAIWSVEVETRSGLIGKQIQFQAETVLRWAGICTILLKLNQMIDFLCLFWNL